MPYISFQQLQGVRNVLHNVFLCLYPPYCVCHILMGTSTSAAGRMHSYALWFIRVRTHLSYYSYSPPFLCVCTRRRSFIILAVHLRSYTAHPRSHTLEPPSCMPSWSYALPVVCPSWTLHPKHRPFHARTNPIVRFHYPAALPRHNACQTNSRGCECLCWCACGGRG